MATPTLWPDAAQLDANRRSLLEATDSQLRAFEELYGISSDEVQTEVNAGRIAWSRSSSVTVPLAPNFRSAPATYPSTAQHQESLYRPLAVGP